MPEKCRWAECKFQTQNYQELFDHFNSHCVDGSHSKCCWTNCGLEKNTPSKLLSHLKYAHTNYRPEWCFSCIKQFHDRSTLRKHFASAHTHKLDTWHCPQLDCPKQYVNVLELTQHCYTSHKNPTAVLEMICEENLTILLPNATDRVKRINYVMSSLHQKCKDLGGVFTEMVDNPDESILSILKRKLGVKDTVDDMSQPESVNNGDGDNQAEQTVNPQTKIGGKSLSGQRGTLVGFSERKRSLTHETLLSPQKEDSQVVSDLLDQFVTANPDNAKKAKSKEAMEKKENFRKMKEQKGKEARRLQKRKAEEEEEKKKEEELEKKRIDEDQRREAEEKLKKKREERQKAEQQKREEEQRLEKIKKAEELKKQKEEEDRLIKKREAEEKLNKKREEERQKAEQQKRAEEERLEKIRKAEELKKKREEADRLIKKREAEERERKKAEDKKKRKEEKKREQEEKENLRKKCKELQRKKEEENRRRQEEEKKRQKSLAEEAELKKKQEEAEKQKKLEEEREAEIIRKEEQARKKKEQDVIWRKKKEQEEAEKLKLEKERERQRNEQLHQELREQERKDLERENRERTAWAHEESPINFFSTPPYHVARDPRQNRPSRFDEPKQIFQNPGPSFQPPRPPPIPSTNFALLPPLSMIPRPPSIYDPMPSIPAFPPPLPFLPPPQVFPFHVPVSVPPGSYSTLPPLPQTPKPFNDSPPPSTSHVGHLPPPPVPPTFSVAPTVQRAPVKLKQTLVPEVEFDKLTDLAKLVEEPNQHYYCHWKDCGNHFDTKTMLANHISLHAQVSDCQWRNCDYISYVFNIHEHLLSHLGTMPSVNNNSRWSLTRIPQGHFTTARENLVQPYIDTGRPPQPGKAPPPIHLQRQHLSKDKHPKPEDPRERYNRYQAEYRKLILPRLPPPPTTTPPPPPGTSSALRYTVLNTDALNKVLHKIDSNLSLSRKNSTVSNDNGDKTTNIFAAVDDFRTSFNLPSTPLLPSLSPVPPPRNVEQRKNNNQKKTRRERKLETRGRSKTPGRAKTRSPPRRGRETREDGRRRSRSKSRRRSRSGSRRSRSRSCDRERSRRRRSKSRSDDREHLRRHCRRSSTPLRDRRRSPSPSHRRSKESEISHSSSPERHQRRGVSPVWPRRSPQKKASRPKVQTTTLEQNIANQSNVNVPGPLATEFNAQVPNARKPLCTSKPIEIKIDPDRPLSPQFEERRQEVQAGLDEIRKKKALGLIGDDTTSGIPGSVAEHVAAQPATSVAAEPGPPQPRNRPFSSIGIIHIKREPGLELEPGELTPDSAVVQQPTSVVPPQPSTSASQPVAAKTFKKSKKRLLQPIVKEEPVEMTPESSRNELLQGPGSQEPPSKRPREILSDHKQDPSMQTLPSNVHLLHGIPQAGLPVQSAPLFGYPVYVLPPNAQLVQQPQPTPQLGVNTSAASLYDLKIEHISPADSDDLPNHPSPPNESQDRPSSSSSSNKSNANSQQDQHLPSNHQPVRMPLPSPVRFRRDSPLAEYTPPRESLSRLGSRSRQASDHSPPRSRTNTEPADFDPPAGSDELTYQLLRANIFKKHQRTDLFKCQWDACFFRDKPMSFDDLNNHIVDHTDGKCKWGNCAVQPGRDGIQKHLKKHIDLYRD